MIATPECESSNVVEASIADLQELFDSRALTSVDLVSKYLHRISVYSNGDLSPDLTISLNPHAFIEAAASDQRRAKGQTIGLLDGIPYIVENASKTNFSVVADDEAKIIRKLQHAGAVLVGQTNTPSMVASRTQQFVFEGAVSPCKPVFSNGSVAATAASFAAFVISDEPVNSDVLQPSNSALVTYTPSRDALSPPNDWHLRPACTVIVPYAKKVEDIVTILDAISANEIANEVDASRKQYLTSPSDAGNHISGSLQSISVNSILKGVRIAAPTIYDCHNQLPDLPQAYNHPEIIALYQRAKADMEGLGAEIIEIPSLPLTKHYEFPSCAPKNTNLPTDCDTTKRSILTAYIHDEISRISNETSGKSLLDLMRKQQYEDWLDENNCDFVLLPAAYGVGRVDVDVDHGPAGHVLRNNVKYIDDNQRIRHCGVPTITMSMGEMQTNGMPVDLIFAGKSGEDFKLLDWAHAYEKATSGRKSLKQNPSLKTDFVETFPFADTAENPYSISLACESADVPELVVERCQFASTDTRRQNDEDTHRSVQIDGYVAVRETYCADETRDQLVIEVFIDASRVSPDQISVRKLEGSMTGRTVFDFSCNALTYMRQERGQENDKKRTPLINSKNGRHSNMVIVLARIGSRGQPSGFIHLI